MLYLKVHRYFFVISMKENYQTKGLYEVPIGLGVRVIVFNATFNNISVISWRSVLLVEETGVPGEKHRPAASHRLNMYIL